jgi:predicted CopG family antitoxin
MPSKTMSVSEDAYDLLDKMKLKDESFSEVIRRLAKRRSIADCAGLWVDVSNEEMDAYLRVVRELSGPLLDSKELKKS